MVSKHLLTSKVKKILFVLVLLAVIAGVAVFAKARLDALQEVPARERAGLPVETATVTRGPVKNTVTYTGTVRAEDRAALAPEIRARIKSISCSEGDRARQGQVLAKLDGSELQSRVNKLEKSLHRAEVDFEHWEQEVDTYKQLWEQGAVPRHEYENVLYKRDKAEAAVEEARAGLEQARQALDDTVLRSPLSGVVTARVMQEGELAVPGQPVLKVASLDSLHVVTKVVQEDLAKIKEGAKALVDLPGGAGEVTSRVQKVHPAVSDKSRTAVVEVSLPRAAREEAGLLPGMSVDVSVELAGKQEAVLVPAGAVTERGGEKFVFVIEEGRAVQREVTTGIEGAGKVEVTGGIEPGAVVVADPPPELYDGREVYVPKGVPAA